MSSSLGRSIKRQAGEYGHFLAHNLFASLVLGFAVISAGILCLLMIGSISPPGGWFLIGLNRIYSALSSMLHAGIGELIRFTWPAVVLAVAFLLLVTRRFERGAAWFATRTSKVKVGEVELEFSPEAAKQLAQSTEEAFNSFRERADREFRRQVAALDIRPLLEATLNNAGARLTNGKTIPDLPNARCTLYVKDILFEDRLYQLTEYYPWDGKPNAGRTFSTRFGIVGRSWRKETHMGEGNVQADRETLMSDWGMTREEASRRTRQRPSYLCAILRAPADDGSDIADGLPVGLFFADCDGQNAFGTDAEATLLAGAIAQAALQSGLRFKLKVLREELNKYSAAIHP